MLRSAFQPPSELTFRNPRLTSGGERLEKTPAREARSRRSESTCFVGSVSEECVGTVVSRNRILWLAVFAVAIAATGASWLYDRAIGFPREIAGHWVRPRVTWYWTGTPPLGYPFPAIVVYGYVDENGRVIRHGPFIERGVRGNTVVTAKTGSYIEDQPDGIFIEYQTFWGTKLRETRYDHGKEISDTWYPVSPLEKSPKSRR